jgi:CopG family nickel-responsive transcriptional regulator
MPDSVARFTISIPPELLATFDEVCASKGYASRSEAIRDAIRDYLISHDWSVEEDGREVVGTITLIYSAVARRLAEELAERQSQRKTQLLSTLHVHLDAERSIAVVVVRGSGREVTALADELISLRGVEHGRLVCSTSAPDGSAP